MHESGFFGEQHEHVSNSSKLNLQERVFVVDVDDAPMFD
jgi:hypothetical protein